FFLKGTTMFPERLKQLRKEAGYTNQTQIAELLKTSQQSYSQWESGKRKPSKTTLEKLSNFFNVSVDYLLGNSDIRNQESLDNFFEFVLNSETLSFKGKTLNENQVLELKQFIQNYVDRL
ncbi:helix-turn-helix domain-containing protein, partial [Streptococcus ruminantium]